jgi:hypothetical protein
MLDTCAGYSAHWNTMIEKMFQKDLKLKYSFTNVILDIEQLLPYSRAWKLQDRTR